MRIVVFGTGGAGGYFGVQLALAGHDVVFIARGEHLRAIRANGLKLETPQGEKVVRANATDNPADVKDTDVILLGVKAWQVTEAAAAIKPMLGHQTFVVPLQNGVEAASELSQVLGAERVLVGLCGTLSFIAGPGRIRSVGGQNFVRFGEQDNRRSDRAERLRQAFADAGVTVEVPPDITKSLWDKFIMVTSFGAVGAVTRAPIGVVRKPPETRALLERCIQESCAVARARKVAIAANCEADTMAFLDSIPPAGTTSLQRDIVDGKPSELDYWSGAAVRLGREVGVPTPTHDFVYRSLLPQELRARGKEEFPL